MRRSGNLRRWANSLQFKLMAAVAAFVTITLSCIGAYWIGSQQRDASAQLEAHAGRVVRVMAKTVAVPVWDLDMAEVASQFDAILQDPEVYSVALFEPGNDKPVFVRERAIPLIDSVERRAPIDYRLPGQQGSRQLGTLEIIYTRYYLYRQLRHVQALIATLVFVLLALLITASYFLFQRLVKKPIDDLVAMTGRIAAGDLDTRVPIGSSNEFGMLAAKFNQMAEQLQQLLQRQRESEEKYRSIIENALEGIFQVALDGKLLGANPAMARVLGYSSVDELRNIQSAEDLYVHPEDREALVAALKEHGVVVQREIEFYRKDKQTIWASVNARVVHAPNGRAIRIDGVATDITARKRYEDALAEREAQLRCLVESNILGVFVWDISGKITEANDELLRITGYTRQDIDAGNARWTGLAAGDNAAALQRQDAPAGERAFAPHETEIVHCGDGRHVPVLIGGTFFVGSTERGIAFVLDLSERKQIESERVARHEAEAASKAKSAFLANMSHELRSPLNVILGFARLVGRDTALPQQVRADLDVIRRSSEHLLALINQVLDLSRIEAGHAALHEANFDLYRLLDEVRAMFSFAAESKNLQLIVGHDAGVPQHVRGDQTKLRQVLINLLGNALKFTRQGHVELRVAMMPSAGGEARLAFSVQDTGPGIAPDELRLLLTPFMQGAAGRLAPEGTGLGLAICKNFIRLMGGELRLASQPGQGTTASFDLPLPPCAAAECGLPPEQLRRAVALAPGQAPVRILVADDNAEARQLLLRLLTPLGCEVREAADGRQAVELWRAWHPQLIWMDMRMPHMNGREATQRIRAAEPDRQTVIIALTASSSEEQQAEFIAAGCDDCLYKPFAERDLLAMMQKYLGLRFIYQDQAATPATAPPDPSALTAIPAPVLAELQRASTELDPDAVAAALAQIAQHDAGLARSLAPLAAEFQYDRILDLIQSQTAKDEGQNAT